MRSIGEMREKVQLLRKEFDGSSGAQKEKLVPMMEIYAAVRYVSGSEFIKLGSYYEAQRLIFTVRKPKQKIDSGLVVRYREKDYEALEIVDNFAWKGMVDIRAKAVGFEGLGNGY